MSTNPESHVDSLVQCKIVNLYNDCSRSYKQRVHSCIVQKKEEEAMNRRK